MKDVEFIVKKPMGGGVAHWNKGDPRNLPAAEAVTLYRAGALEAKTKEGKAVMDKLLKQAPTDMLIQPVAGETKDAGNASANKADVETPGAGQGGGAADAGNAGGDDDKGGGGDDAGAGAGGEGGEGAGAGEGGPAATAAPAATKDAGDAGANKAAEAKPKPAKAPAKKAEPKAAGEGAATPRKRR